MFILRKNTFNVYFTKTLIFEDALNEETLCTTSSSGLPNWRQSPIDISRIAVWTERFPPLFLTNYWSNDGTAILTNTGRTGYLGFRETGFDTSEFNCSLVHLMIT